MSPPISEFVDIVLSAASARVKKAGFGIPLIAAYHTKNVDLVREYVDPSDLVDDGFAVTDPVYLAASAMAAQNPRPSKFLVGRLQHATTQSFKVTPVAGNLVTYDLYVNDGETEHHVSVTSDASGTVAEVVALLKTAIDALSITGLTTTNNTTHLTAAMTSGLWVDIYSADLAKATVEQDHSASTSLSADLDAIKDANDTWYAFGTLFNSRAQILAAAAWAESNKKLYMVQVTESASATAVYDATGATDIGSKLRSQGYDYTSWLYHPSLAEFADFAWLGRVLPLTPGSDNWAFKQLSGVGVTVLTATQRARILAKYGNTYEELAGVGGTSFGTVASGEWIDKIRNLDWLVARIGETIISAFLNSDKVPYSDAGAVAIEGLVEAKLAAAVSAGVLLADPAPAVTVPVVADVDAEDRAARLLPNIQATGAYQGAINKVGIRLQITI